MLFRSFGGWGIVPLDPVPKGIAPTLPDERRKMYILDVKTPGKLLDYRGRSVRTPAKFIVTSDELKSFKVKFRQVGITEYKVRSKTEVDKEIASKQTVYAPHKVMEEEVTVEEIMDNEEETRSVLDQLIKDAEKE